MPMVFKVTEYVFFLTNPKLFYGLKNIFGYATQTNNLIGFLKYRNAGEK